MTPGLLHEGKGTGNYGGSGWIGALQQLFIDARSEHTLALAFVSATEKEKTKKNGIIYYPIYEKPESGIRKLCRYYGGYKSWDREHLVPQIKEVISDFHPDVIHLFGLENQLATILGRTAIPTVVHLQGLLGPVANAFYPNGFNHSSFIWPPTKREWLYRNGFLYEKKKLDLRSRQEQKLFKEARFFMGRTDWDFHVSQLMSKESMYYKVNEALRQPFYENAGKWRPNDGKMTITSTISETLYKGLDLILKTALILKRETTIDFEWNVTGVKADSNFRKFIEHNVGIKGADVNVRYCGIMNAQQLVGHSLKSNVYVHPSYIDNSPNSVCEAQLLGLPVIATHVGGVSSLMEHKKSGILVPANEPHETAFWIMQFHNNPDMAKELGRNGYELAKARHAPEQIIKDLFNAYKDIAG